MSTTDLFAGIRKSYVARQLLARRALLAVRKVWRQVDQNAIRATWAAQVGPQVYQIVSGAQYDSAAAAEATVTAMLVAQGLSPESAGQIDPAAFSGVASDGRDLASLLELSNLQALRSIKLGVPPAQALVTAGRWLEMVVGTQISDANRVARGASIVARRSVDGYYRVLSPPSCSRCVVLAGKWFRWNAGFERHPGCDCDQVAAGSGDLDDHPELWSPKAYFESISQAEQDRIFGKAGAQAIRDGADMSQVVNVRSGMSTASVGGRDVSITNVGTTKRGYYAYVQRELDRLRNQKTQYDAQNVGKRGYVKNYIERRVVRPRLMPEEIYRIAGNDRDEALRLLAGNGYLVGSVKADAARAFAS